MILVITEKAIAGRRIAQILSHNKVKEEKRHGATIFEFEKKNEKYSVVPLKGHIVEVDFPKNYAPWIGTDLKKLVFAEIIYFEREKSIANLLRRTARDCKKIVFATDADREGESIALEALNAIKKEKNGLKVERALFSAITPEEINNAFLKTGKLDVNLADSADARREIDLVWGAVLTRFLSLVSGQLGKEFLSAGRVQSPTLALVVQREKERIAFKPKNFYEVTANLEKDNIKFLAVHKKGRFWEKKKAEKAASVKEKTAIVEKTRKIIKKIKKPVPFNTTLFLRAATSIGVSAGKAMSLAEELYQEGLISYPRTDNQSYPKSIKLKKILSKLSVIEEFAYPTGILLSKKTLVPSSGKSTKDHPPIHPVGAPKKRFSGPKWRIYELVCRRFFATLADNAKTENISAELRIGSEPFIARGQRYLEFGWKEFYPYSKAEEMFLPKLEKGDTAKVLKVNLLGKKTQPPPRYSQGSLIKAMEELGLGTKSTRHQIIQKLYARNYLKGYKAIEPSKVAFAIVEALEKNNGKINEPEMTAELEKEMDFVAAGNKTKQEVVNESREMLSKILSVLIEKKNSIGKEIRKALASEAVYFKCTNKNCKGNLVVRKGYSNKRFLGCSAYPDCKVTYPLPQKGKILPLEKFCSECNAPIIKVVGRRRAYEMCINMDCKTKKEWKNKALKKQGSETQK